MEVTTQDGCRLWVETRGSSEPLVLLSGMSQSHEAWAPNMGLADDFRLILPDNRGTGRSGDFPADDTDPTTGLMAEDVIAVLDALEIPRAHIVGHSMGGRIAQWLAIRFPRRVGALILCSTSCGESHGVPRSDEAERKLARNNPVELALLNYSSGWLGKNGELVGIINRSTSERSAQRSAHLRATHGHDSWSSLPRIQAPTLIVHGTDDQINPVGNAEILAERIADAETLIIPGGRHNVAAEFAPLVDSRIREFCHQHPLED